MIQPKLIRYEMTEYRVKFRGKTEFRRSELPCLLRRKPGVVDKVEDLGLELKLAEQVLYNSIDGQLEPASSMQEALCAVQPRR